MTLGSRTRTADPGRLRSCWAPVLSTALIGLLVGLGGCGAPRPPTSGSADWRADMKELRIVVRGDEADPQTARRWDAFKAYLARITGLPVRTFESTDYNGSIQAIASGQVDLAQMGGGSYANVDAQVGELVVPILLARQSEGNTGYYTNRP